MAHQHQPPGQSGQTGQTGKHRNTPPSAHSDQPDEKRPGSRAKDRDRERDTETPFAYVIREWMWTQRPPVTTGTLAHKLTIAGKPVSRQTIQNWIYRGIVPTMPDTLEVLAILNIPLETLLAEYQRAGMPVPPLAAHTQTQASLTLGTPEPRPYQQPQQQSPHARPADPWDEMIAATVTSMQRAGISPEAIAEVVAHIDAKRQGRTPHDQLPQRQAEEQQYGPPITRQPESPGAKQNNQSNQSSQGNDNHPTPPPSQIVGRGSSS